jgi:hypothetical protein
MKGEVGEEEKMTITSREAWGKEEKKTWAWNGHFKTKCSSSLGLDISPFSTSGQFRSWPPYKWSPKFVISYLYVTARIAIINKIVKFFWRSHNGGYEEYLLLLLPRRYSPGWALASLFFLGFRNNDFLPGGVVNPTPNPQLSWRTNVFCRGCLP